MGDPQAPLEKVLGVLDAHHLLSDDGMLSKDVGLVSMGDHFDWGGADDAETAAADGVALFAWLLAHAPDHVCLIAGNHDLGRIGELSAFDDDRFRTARARARVAYENKDQALEDALRKDYPELPTAELAARDFAAFSVAQRNLVEEALRAGRLQAAKAVGNQVLLTHAGITRHDLDALSIDGEGAEEIASALNAALHEARALRPLRIQGLHEPGNAAIGEGGGMFYHRPSSGSVPRGATRRRFDPRTIPIGLTQVIGHIGDEKCRKLMPEWASGEPANGRLRTLVISEHPSYRAGIHAGDTRIIFTDGAMSKQTASAYELLDLGQMQALAATSFH
jgi:hypothetical protein